MRKIILFLLSLIMSFSAMASPLPQGSTIPFIITSRHGDDATVNFRIPQGTELIPGGIYYFNGRDEKGRPLELSQGIYQKTDANGIPIFSNFTSANEGEGAPPNATTSGPQQGDGGGGGVDYGQINSGAMYSAMTTGVARAIYRGLIYTDAYQKQMNEINTRTDVDVQAIAANAAAIARGVGLTGEQFKKVYADFKTSLEATGDNGSGSSLTHGDKYHSSNPALVSDLKELENILRSVRCTDDRKLLSQHWGLAMLLSSDQASTDGDGQSAEAYKRYAEAFADIAIGLDPLTGPIRDIYEAFTGKNLITGEGLDVYSRSFAILGAATFGFGSKIGKALKIFKGLKSTVNLEHSIHAAERIAIQAEHSVESVERSAHSAADYQKYLRDLRGGMERPAIQDPGLRKNVYERYWKEEGSIGNKSTASAIRYEKITGEPVRGKWHSEKGKEFITYFENWLTLNPNAAGTDKAAVENIILDLRDALKGDL